MNIKHCVVIFLLLLSSGNIAAQNKLSDYIYADTIIGFPNIESSYNNSIITTQLDRIVYFFPYSTYKDKDNLCIYSLDIDNYKTAQIEIVHKGIAERLTNEHYTSFRCMAVTPKYVLLAYGHRIMRYKKSESGPRYVLDKEIETPQIIDEMRYIGGEKIVIFDSYLSHKEVGYDNSAMSVVDIESGECKQIHPYYNTPLLSFFVPFKCIDANSGNIVYANRAEYSFVFFNQDLVQTDSCRREPTEWNGVSREDKQRALAAGNNSAEGERILEIKDAVRPMYWTKDKLNWIYFVDSNHIVTVCQHNLNLGLEKPNFTLDVWTKKGGIWSLTAEDIADENYSYLHPKQITTPNRLRINFLSKNTHIFSDKIVNIGMDGTDICPIGITPKKYRKDRDKWLRKHKPYLQVVVYNHTLCK